jgi:hypothetical protein
MSADLLARVAGLNAIAAKLVRGGLPTGVP